MHFETHSLQFCKMETFEKCSLDFDDLSNISFKHIIVNAKRVSSSLSAAMEFLCHLCTHVQVKRFLALILFLCKSLKFWSGHTGKQFHVLPIALSVIKTFLVFIQTLSQMRNLRRKNPSLSKSTTLKIVYWKPDTDILSKGETLPSICVTARKNASSWRIFIVRITEQRFDVSISSFKLWNKWSTGNDTWKKYRFNSGSGQNWLRRHFTKTFLDKSFGF